MNQTHADRHAQLVLSAIRAEAVADRLPDNEFRAFVLGVTEGLTLPAPRFTVIPGGDAA